MSTPQTDAHPTNSAMAPAPDQADLHEQFLTDGYVRFDGVFDEFTIESLLDGRPRPYGRSNALIRFSSHPLLAHLAREFLGPEARLLNTLLYEYMPEYTAQREYFNDHSVYNAELGSTVNCVIALTDIDNSVAQRVIPGGHRADNGYLRDDYRPRRDVTALTERCEPMSAGTMIIYASSLPRRFGSGIPNSPAVFASLHYATGAQPSSLREAFRRGDEFRLPPEESQPVVRNGQLITMP